MTEYKKSLISTILFLLIITSSAVYDISSRYNKEVSNTKSRVINTSFLIKEWLNGSFKASDYVLQDIISQIPLDELKYPNPNPKQQIKTTEFIKSKLETLPVYYHGVGTADKNCIITHTYNKPPFTAPIGFDGSNREWCNVHKKNAKLGQYVTTSFASNVGTQSVLQNRAFINSSNEFAGMVGLELSLNFFQQWLEQIVIERNGVLAIVDTNLILLARKPQLPEKIGKKLDDTIVATFLSSKETYKSFSNISPLDEKKRLYGVRKVDDLPFVIVVGEAYEDFLKEWKHITITTVIAVVIVWIFSLLILRNHWKQLKLHDELDHLANTDELTQISNRRSFMNHTSEELKRIQRYKTKMALLMLDIDKFKLINDNNGHATGDRAIIAFTNACKESIREIDILGRLGGDEFAILLPNTDIQETQTVVERIRLAIESCEFFNDEEQKLSLTSSIGVTIVDSTTSSIDEIMIRVDEALYLAKDKGRNRIEFA